MAQAEVIPAAPPTATVLGAVNGSMDSKSMAGSVAKSLFILLFAINAILAGRVSNCID